MAVAIRRGLASPRFDWRTRVALCGPAIVASVAYMDPGNIATNMQAGASFGYGLVWVVIAANAIAMLFQALAAKVGIVTGRNLAELCREHFPRPLVFAMWVAAEIAAMATDLAEFLGGAIGLSLLFGLSLFWGMVATGVITVAILHAQRHGERVLDYVVGGFVGAIGLSYLTEVCIAPPDWRAATLQTVFPHLAGPGAVTLAVGIIGATVMPHAIFLHSALTQRRDARTDAERTRLVRFSNREVVVALSFAGAVNVAMVLMAAAAFHAGHPDVAQIETAYHTLVPLLGAGAAGIFLFSLMASGISSSVVGTMAGSVVMAGFVGFRIPLWLRRAVTMVPAFVVIGYGIDATHALVVSQVVLSLILPVPVIALIVLARRRDIMGTFALGRATTAWAVLAAAVVLGLNGVLLAQTAGWL
jgi:manganese transport protein